MPEKASLEPIDWNDWPVTNYGLNSNGLLVMIVLVYGEKVGYVCEDKACLDSVKSFAEVHSKYSLAQDRRKYVIVLTSPEQVTYEFRVAKDNEKNGVPSVSI
jgi:hypothetical protein